MDPVSATGIGLSVVSLALQVFSGWYQIFTEVADLPANYQHLRTRLRIEQSRHLNWGEQIGLLEDSLQLPSQVLRLHRNLVLDVLLEVSQAFASALRIAGKYEDLGVPDLQISKGSSPKQTRFLERAKSLWRASGQAASQLQWAMIKHEDFEALIVRLVGYNDAMESILDRSALEDLRIMQERSNLLLLQLTEEISHLHTLTEALDIKPPPATAVTNVTFQSLTFGGPASSAVQVSSLAAFKIQNISAPANFNGSDLYIQHGLSDIADPDHDKDRTMTVLDGKQVFVEWRTLVNANISIDDKHILETRLAKLALLLSREDKPVEFRSPRSAGYCKREIEDGIQYGLVYEVPSLGNTWVGIDTLRDAFEYSLRPTLTTRIRLANSMVESLLYLHAVNWLHKGFRSDNIIFASPVAGSIGSHEVLASPLISGFDFSRPDTSDEITVKSTSQARHDYYKHPQLLHHSTARSQKSHDIYALGIVLIELALWSPIETIMATILGKPLTTSRIPHIRERLLIAPYGDFADALAAVAAQAGEVYASVARRCIEGGPSLGIDTNANQADPVVAATLQRVFYDDVYLQLKSIRV